MPSMKYWNGTAWTKLDARADSVKSGAAFPATPAEYDLFTLTTDKRTYQYVNSAWVKLAVSTDVTTVPDGTTTTKGIVQLTDSASSTSTTTAATPASVKVAKDAADAAAATANAALPKVGGTLAGPVTLDNGAADTPNLKWNDPINNTWAYLDVYNEHFRLVDVYRNGAIQSNHFDINLQTGAITTKNNTLDDGAGAAAFAGDVTIQNGGNVKSIGGAKISATGLGKSFALIGADASSAALYAQLSNGTTVLAAGIGGTKQVTTANNTLDDGTGAIVLPNGVGLWGKTTTNGLQKLAASGSDGHIYYGSDNFRYNTSTGDLELFKGGAWQTVGETQYHPFTLESNGGFTIPNANTWATAVNISGKGFLTKAFIRANGNAQIYGIRITVDGTVVYYGTTTATTNVAMGVWREDEMVSASQLRIANSTATVNVFNNSANYPYTGGGVLPIILSSGASIPFNSSLVVELMCPNSSPQTVSYNVAGGIA